METLGTHFVTETDDPSECSTCGESFKVGDAMRIIVAQKYEEPIEYRGSIFGGVCLLVCLNCEAKEMFS